MIIINFYLVRIGIRHNIVPSTYILFALRICFFYTISYHTQLGKVPLLIFINIYYQKLLNYVTTQTKRKKNEMKNEIK